MLIMASGLHKQFNDKPILQNESINIGERDKIGLIGVNGCGKSTLLKILDGKEDAEGKIIRSRGLKTSRLPQNPVFTEATVWQEMKTQNEQNQHPLEDYELRTFLTKLDLNENDEIAHLSGGQQKRLSLALCLSREADLLLLDEPTNHLDTGMIDWLESYISRTTTAVLLITHDRYFLEKVCDRIVELDHGVLYDHEGGYQQYLEDKALRQEQVEEAARKHRNLYRQELEWVRAGCQARSTKQRARLDRFEELRKVRFEKQEKNLEMDLASTRLGSKTLEWKDLAFAYPDGDLLFSDFSYLMKKHDRVGIVGLNGTGKSTFLKLVAGDLQPTHGTLELGSTVRIGYFRQDHEMEDLSMRVIDYIEESARELTTSEGRISASAMLERFLFDKNAQYLTLDRLSGGERRRLYLLKILMEAPNVLLLDEPTNDLDLVTLEVLEDYLDDFPGIVITVSHDRYFLDRVCDYVFVLENGHFTQNIGGYSDRLVSSLTTRDSEPRQAAVPSSGASRRSRAFSMTSAQKRELEKLPGELDAMQERIDALNDQMNTETDFEKMDAICQERDSLEAQMEEKTARWMELEEMREKEKASF